MYIFIPQPLRNLNLMLRYFLLLCFFGMSFINHAQTTDIARVEYMHIPFSQSDNNVGRFRALLQVPIPLDKLSCYPLFCKSVS